jgi:hypothetical protein
VAHGTWLNVDVALLGSQQLGVRCLPDTDSRLPNWEDIDCAKGQPLGRMTRYDIVLARTFDLTQIPLIVMPKPRPVLPLASDEIVYLKSVQAFLHGRYVVPALSRPVASTKSTFRVALEKRTYAKYKKTSGPVID